MDFSTPTSSASVSTRIPTNFAGHVAMTPPYWTKAGQTRYCLALLFTQDGYRHGGLPDQPGVQLYTGNWMSGHLRRKHDHPPLSCVPHSGLERSTSRQPQQARIPSTRLNPGGLPLDDDLPLHARSLAS